MTSALNAASFDGDARVLHSPHLRVPLAQWIDAVSDWPELDEPLYRFACTVAGIDGVPATWSEFSTWLVEHHIGEWLGSPGSRAVVFRPDWRDRLAEISGLEPSAEDIRPLLIEQWLRHPRRDDTASIATLARRIEAWQLMAQVWLVDRRWFGRGGEGPTASAFRTAPDAARKRCPILTWAMAISEAEVATRNREQTLMRVILRDAVRLHSDWASHEDPDAAVLAGSMWMVAQRLLPSPSTDGGIEEAWRTRCAVSERISTDARSGAGPSPLARTVFSAFSAQLCLARNDLTTAIIEARAAQIVGGAGPGIAWFARGIEALSSSLLGLPVTDARVPHRSQLAPRAGETSLRDAGITLLRLAEGLTAMDALDRDQVNQVLDVVTPSAAMGASAWSALANLHAMRAALWGDPAQALEILDQYEVRFGGALPEHVESLGRQMLGRPRNFALTKLGATDAASTAVGLVPQVRQWAPRALALLWRGDLAGTVRAADAGLFEKATPPSARSYLVVVRAAALVRDPATPAEIKEEAARSAIVRCTTERRLLPLATIPPTAQAALLDEFEKSAGVRGQETLAEVRRVLGTLSRSDAPEPVQISLTKRERVLLPLLATADSVPDIAHGLHLSPNTVRKQVVTLRSKFNAANRAQLIKNAREAGFLD